MGPVRGERNGSSSHFSPQPPKLEEGYFTNRGVIASHLTVIALSIPYWSFVTRVAGFPSLERFPSARSPNEEGVSGLSLGQ